MSETKIYLSEKEIPTRWYNIQADMPNLPKPPLNPQTMKPAGPEDLTPIFPMDLILQEMGTERWIEIPEEVRELYKMWRPSPLIRARQLEKALDTPAKIYFKYEGVSPAGSHKLNSAIPQAYYNKKAGIKRLATETGAGQWGSALSIACKFFDLECVVYMVKVSYQQKPYRRSLMNVYGAQVFASPSEQTQAGRKILAENPNNLGSLGIAISEAVEDAVLREDTNYALGSVLNHVALHQTVIGLETKKQFESLGEYPDIVIACCGGGSNFGGLAFPFVHDNLKEGKKTRLIAVEPEACPTLTRGTFAYDFGDVAGMTPLLSMYTLGKDFMPDGIHAGGLRYHGASTLVSQLYKDKLIEARAVGQVGTFEAALLFAQNEAILPAPESSHAIRAAIDEALLCKESGEPKTIVFCLSGHGHFDLTAYENYLSGQLKDHALPEAELKAAINQLPVIPGE
ncbi:MAG: TrpB-like pyridoxal phosphate-dependent enzyme [Peptococcaceae bacterium]|jgi:tryptophan synthase beta chain|nr:TrpB-like pyridoxal phosphate-dependent enzyme [Peptococcaceae bacterium]